MVDSDPSRSWATVPPAHDSLQPSLSLALVRAFLGWGAVSIPTTGPISSRVFCFWGGGTQPSFNPLLRSHNGAPPTPVWLGGSGDRDGCTKAASWPPAIF